MEEEPERLSEVKGISEKMAMAIAEQVEDKKDMRQAMMFLQNYGITMNLAAKIYQQYGPSLYGIIRENPYRLADDIPGVGFKMADEIAERVGIFTDSDYRIKAGILYTLLQATGNGHTYLPQTELFAQASELLKVEPSSMEKHLMDMQIDRRVVVKQSEQGPVIYSSQYYYLELNAARMLHDLNIKGDTPETEIKENLKKVQEIQAQEARQTQDRQARNRENQTQADQSLANQAQEEQDNELQSQDSIRLDSLQEKAVYEAVNSGLLVITGGPGTGKTCLLYTSYLFGMEESYGCLIGTYARDKDAISATAALCEAAAYYKQKGMTLWDAMVAMYDKYGYYKDAVKSIGLSGIEGLAKIQSIMETLRSNTPAQVGSYHVVSARDYKLDTITDMATGEVKPTGLPSSNVLYYDLNDGAWICVRPSGTEPKIKFYYGIKGTSMEDADAKAESLGAAVMAMVDKMM